MEITITWTKLISFFLIYHGLRYGYHTFLKYATGCTCIFDPAVPFDAAWYAQITCREHRYELSEQREKSVRLEAELQLAQLRLEVLQGLPAKRVPHKFQPKARRNLR